MKFSGCGGEGMTIGQIVANATSALPVDGTGIRERDGWRYVQISGTADNGTHLTIRPSGLADHTSTYLDGFPIGRDRVR